MPTYMIDKETRELIPKSEWVKKYGESPKSGIMIINRKFEAYESPITGEVITSHRRRDEDMKASGCVDYEPSLKGEIERDLDRADKELETKMGDDMEHMIKEMPARKQEQLEQELNSGLDISLERT